VRDPAKGDIWWGETPHTAGRPYLVMTRDSAIPVLNRVVVAPVTRTVRGIPSEVALGPDEGLPAECVASMDNLLTLRKSMLVRKMGSLPDTRLSEACDALRAATDC
jgi:mRNA interferase MazF